MYLHIAMLTKPLESQRQPRPKHWLRHSGQLLLSARLYRRRITHGQNRPEANHDTRLLSMGALRLHHWRRTWSNSERLPPLHRPLRHLQLIWRDGSWSKHTLLSHSAPDVLTIIGRNLPLRRRVLPHPRPRPLPRLRRRRG